MELSTRLKFLLFSLLISAYAHGKGQYACFMEECSRMTAVVKRYQGLW